MTTKITVEERKRLWLPHGDHVDAELVERLLDALEAAEARAEAAEVRRDEACVENFHQEIRAERAEAALAVARGYALRCLRASGDDRDDAVRDLDSYGFSTNAGQEILDEVATLRAQVDEYAARAEAEMLALRAREENAEAETETRLLHGEIEMLRSQVAKLREALRNLLDEQNGPPLHRRRVEWEWASDNAELSLANTAPNGGEK